jgi:hypothetical protein
MVLLPTNELVRMIRRGGNNHYVIRSGHVHPSLRNFFHRSSVLGMDNDDSISSSSTVDGPRGSGTTVAATAIGVRTGR